MSIDISRALEIQRGALAAGMRMTANTAPDSRLWEDDAALAAIIPAAPDQPMVNWATASPARAIGGSLTELAHQYERAGVRAWKVWIDPDPDARAALLAAGYRRTEDYPAITIDLDTFAAPDLSALDYDTFGDMATLGHVNERSFESGHDLSKVFVQRPSTPQISIYQARWDGYVASAFTAMDYAYNGGLGCALHFGGTLPQARGHGLWTRLFAAALVDARHRGCATASGQSSAMGLPVYTTLGFRTLFRYETYERRLR